MKSMTMPGPLKRPVCAGVSLLLSILFALIFLGSNSPLGPAIGSDNAIYLTMGTALSNGYAPYTQVFDHKGPLLFIIETIPQMLSGGYSTLAVFIMETLFLWGCLLAIGTAARRMNVSGLIAQLIFLVILAPIIDGGNYCEEYTNLFTLLCVLLLMHVFDRDMLIKRSSFYFLPSLFYGALFMLAFLTRANNMLPIAGMLLGAAICLIASRNLMPLFVCALGFLTGCAAAALPIVLWLWSEGALSEAIYGAFIHNMMYAETGGGSRFDMLLRNPYGWRALFMAALSCCGGAAWAMRKKRPVVSLIMIFGAASGGFAAFISHKFYSHYLMIGAPLAAIGAAMLCGVIREKKIAIPRAAAIFVAGACAVCLAGYGLRENGERVKLHADYMLLKEQTSELLVHVPKEEKNELLPYRTEPKWYVAAEAMPYLRFYFLQEILAQADPSVMEEIVLTLENNPPKWLVIYYNREFGPPYDERVAEIFSSRYEFVDAKGQYQLLRLKGE